MVVFYTATHPSVRCSWQWGDNMTEVENKLISLAEARTRFGNMKRSSERLTEFRNYGSWYEYYQDGKWYAVGYYGVGQEPFSKP